MSLALRVGEDAVAVDAGATVPLTIEVANRGDAEDTFELMVEGIDATWTAIPVPTFTLPAHDARTEKILVRPPRESESAAADYPFVIRVRSLTTGESERVPVVLTVKPFHSLSLDAGPKKGTVTAFQPQTTFEVTVMNLGNSPHQVQLTAGDLDDACVFEFAHDKVTVGPGQQRTVELNVRANRPRWVGSSRLNGVTVTGRSTSVPTVAASGQVQLEQRPATSPGALAVLLMLIVMAVVWWSNMPKPPIVAALELSRSEVEVGQAVTITWRAENATAVDILINGAVARSSIGAQGSMDFVPDEAKTYEIAAVARSGEKTSLTVTRPLLAIPAPPVEAPVIQTFRIDPTEANVGDRLLITYKFNDAVVRATLSPNNLDLNPKLGAIEVDVLREGEIDYRILAENAKGQTAERTVRVKVVKRAAARVVLFRADPPVAPFENPIVKLEWQLMDAVRAEIAYNGETVVVDARQGLIELPVERRTTFTLTAYDAEGRTVSQAVTVDAAPRPTPPPDDPVPADPPPAGGPGSGSGTGGTQDPASGPGGEMPPAGTTGGNR